MGLLFYDNTKVCVLPADEDVRDFTRVVAEEATATLPFDAATNPNLQAQIEAAPTQYSIVGGQLLLNGNPIAINPDGEAENIRKGLATRIQAARNYIDNQSPTQAQSVAAIKGLLEFMIYVVQHREKLIN